MIPNPLGDMQRPLFSKIALIFLITSLAVVSAVGGFFFFQRPTQRHSRDSFRKNVSYFVDSLADRIGNPPDTAKAATIAHQLGLDLGVEGPNLHWASSPNVPPLNVLIPECDADPDALPDISMGHHEGKDGKTFFALVSRGSIHYIFLYPGSAVFATPWSKILILLVLIVVILVFSYVMIQWLIKPISLLLTGVSEIGAGNLEYQITLPQGHAEFQSLADTFNQMSGKIRSMIHAKERLLIDVSHELKSPLARMKVALEMLPKSANQKSLARAASEMEIMLSEILESERLKSAHGALSKSAIDLPLLVVQLARSYRSHTAGVKVIKPRKFPVVQADESKTTTVLKNVIENSLKYSQGKKQAVEISFSTEPNWAKVNIRDFGIGIPEVDLPLVFEPFYRVDKSRTKKTGGYGLGLSLCREIMHAHGGEITIQSKSGSGTEVSLAFPCS